MPEIRAIILAAGKGTRMGSRLPKVVLPIHGKPIIKYITDACKEAGVEKIYVVVSSDSDHVRKAISEKGEKNKIPSSKNITEPNITQSNQNSNEPKKSNTEVIFVNQYERLGTGHAVMMAAKYLKDFNGILLVFVGDCPFITKDVIQILVDKVSNEDFDAAIITGVFDDPPPYGRIIRNDIGNVIDIIEEKDADEITKKIKEVNSSHYCFKSAKMLPLLSKINNKNAQNEYYFTDIVRIMAENGCKIDTIVSVNTDLLIGINTKEDLENAHDILEKN